MHPCIFQTLEQTASRNAIAFQALEKSACCRDTTSTTFRLESGGFSAVAVRLVLSGSGLWEFLFLVCHAFRVLLSNSWTSFALRRSNVWNHCTTMKRLGLILLFLVIAFLPSLTAVTVSTHGWYFALVKPFWHPPQWVFGPVWMVLYILIGLAGYFAWMRGGCEGRTETFSIYVAQLILNALWTPLFFGLQHPFFALADLIALWFLILLCIGLFAMRSWVAAWLMLPYFLWVSFAGALNAAFVVMN